MTKFEKKFRKIASLATEIADLYERVMKAGRRFRKPI